MGSAEAGIKRLTVASARALSATDLHFRKQVDMHYTEVKPSHNRKAFTTFWSWRCFVDIRTAQWTSGRKPLVCRISWCWGDAGSMLTEASSGRYNLNAASNNTTEGKLQLKRHTYYMKRRRSCSSGREVAVEILKKIVAGVTSDWVWQCHAIIALTFRFLDSPVTVFRVAAIGEGICVSTAAESGLNEQIDTVKDSPSHLSRSTLLSFHGLEDGMKSSFILMLYNGLTEVVIAVHVNSSTVPGGQAKDDVLIGIEKVARSKTFSEMFFSTTRLRVESSHDLLANHQIHYQHTHLRWSLPPLPERDNEKGHINGQRQSPLTFFTSVFQDSSDREEDRIPRNLGDQHGPAYHSANLQLTDYRTRSGHLPQQLREKSSAEVLYTEIWATCKLEDPGYREEKLGSKVYGTVDTKVREDTQQASTLHFRGVNNYTSLPSAVQVRIPNSDERIFGSVVWVAVTHSEDSFMTLIGDAITRKS
ncbi:hypothetical protein CLF_108559 [Clonorchis sinensis]|uniref:Uncharacterized protein n=1 Tax=Clonorchis sinensis TaxID=79923 RepID=G7YRQ9_CLOSI|nr:hypothetical protein CLF_108559 [Clonorchis sinensis]